MVAVGKVVSSKRLVHHAYSRPDIASLGSSPAVFGPILFPKVPPGLSPGFLHLGHASLLSPHQAGNPALIRFYQHASGLNAYNVVAAADPARKASALTNDSACRAATLLRSVCKNRKARAVTPAADLTSARRVRDQKATKSRGWHQN